MLTHPHFLAVIRTFRNQWLIQASLPHGCTRLDFLHLSNIRHSILSLPEYPSDGHLEYFLCVLVDFVHEHAVPVFPVVPVHQAHVLEEGLREGAQDECGTTDGHYCLVEVQGDHAVGPVDEAQLPDEEEADQGGEGETKEGTPEVDALVRRIRGQVTVVEEDAQVGEVGEGCIPDVREGTLMEDFHYGMRGALKQQVVYVRLWVGCEVGHIVIQDKRHDLGQNKDNRCGL